MITASKKLGNYLTQMGFEKLYNWIVPYYIQEITPFGLNICNINAHMCLINEMVEQCKHNVRLAALLLYPNEIEMCEFSEAELDIIIELCEMGYLYINETTIVNEKIQLIAHKNIYLFIDSRLGFQHDNLANETYIGIDSYILIRYIDLNANIQSLKALDLCTGTGIIALYLAKSDFVKEVEATDIDSKALVLAEFNIGLNNLNSKIKLLNQSIDKTVLTAGKYDIITANPPFVPVWNKETHFPIFAQGLDSDGLGYYRQVIFNVDRLLLPEGVCYMVGEFVGDESKPYFAYELETIAKNKRLDIKFFLEFKKEGYVYLDQYLETLKIFNLGGFDQEDIKKYFIQKLNLISTYIGVIEIRHSKKNTGSLECIEKY